MRGRIMPAEAHDQSGDRRRASRHGPGKGEGEATESFPNRYASPDGRVARTTPAALREVTDDGDQLIDGEPVAARAAMRGRPED